MLSGEAPDHSGKVPDLQLQPPARHRKGTILSALAAFLFDEAIVLYQKGMAEMKTAQTVG